MEVTNVQIQRVDNDSDVKAYANLTIDNAIAVHGIKIVNGKDGLFLGMPSRKKKDGMWADIVHPINNEARAKIVTAVMDAYEASANNDSPNNNS